MRWTVRERGLTLAGPPPQNLIDPITEEMLKSEIYKTLNDWGQEILDHPDRFNNRFYQAFIVLSYCRMLHDLKRGYPGSKPEGAEWAKANLDPMWAELIDGTWEGRLNPALKVRQPADPVQFEKTLRFVEFVMGESTRYWSSN